MFRKILLTAVFAAFVGGINGQTTEFSYQGRLLDSSLPPTANYDFEFSLWDSLANGTQVGTTQTFPGVSVTSGLFNVRLDFGANFPGAQRFLQIEVRPTGGGAYTTLAPRQAITSGPYAIRAINSTTADTATNATTANNALNLGGVAASQFVVTTDPRMTNPRDPLSGSNNYIQNQDVSPQSSSTFNISGNGRIGGGLTADSVTSARGYNIGGNRVLSVDGTNNIFVGVSAGGFSFFGNDNAFFGSNAGSSTLGSRNNAYFGSSSGRSSNGDNNSFFGANAGSGNSTGSNNVFFGNDTGLSNINGSNNTIIGWSSNVGFSFLVNATAIGARALVTQDNSLILGSISGVNGAASNTNVGIGTTAPTQRLHIVGNGLFAGDLTVTGTLNANLPTGSNNYIQNTNTQQATSNFSISGTGSANILNAATQYNIGGDRILSNAGTDNLFAGVGAGQANFGSYNTFFGTSAGQANTDGIFNTYFGVRAGLLNATGIGNTIFGANAGLNDVGNGYNAFFGSQVGQSNTTGAGNTLIGYNADVGLGNLFNATAIGADAQVSQSNSLVLGSINGVNDAFSDTNVGIGTTAPTQRLHVVGNGLFTGDLTVTGTLNANFPAGSNNYIQNTNTQQATSNFNISGNGTAGGTLSGNVINSTTQYNIGGNRALIMTDTNIFAGLDAGQFNTGTGNAFFGIQAGFANQTGGGNSFFGASAGAQNTIGLQNAFFGSGSGFSNTSGNINSFFGTNAGFFNTSGSGNSFVGNNTGYNNTDGSGNSFFGNGAGHDNTSGSTNAFFGNSAGTSNTTGEGNSYLGFGAGGSSSTGNYNSAVGFGAATTDNLSFATAIGALSEVSTSNTIALGRSNGLDTVVIYGLGAGGSEDLCRNVDNQISACSSSLRYKSDVQRFTGGLNLVRNLRPITFRWNNSNALDLGFGAEDVEKVEPLLTIRNAKGEIEGVKYKQITTVLVNAVNEQQAQIEAQQKQIDELKKIVCSLKPDAEVCKK